MALREIIAASLLQVAEFATIADEIIKRGGHGGHGHHGSHAHHTTHNHGNSTNEINSDDTGGWIGLCVIGAIIAVPCALQLCSKYSKNEFSILSFLYL